MKKTLFFFSTIFIIYFFGLAVLIIHSKSYGSKDRIDNFFDLIKFNYVYEGLNLKTNIIPHLYDFFDFKNLFVKKEVKLRFIFSNSDVQFNDSIKSNAISNGLFSDELKTWRKAKILFDNELINIKYKYHGTSIFNYSKGYSSYKIKSKEHILGYNSFVLVNGNEMDYKMIFFNSLADNFNLYCEDRGRIIPVFDDSYKDFYMYNRFDNDYFVSKYQEDLIFEFKKPYITKTSFIDETDRFYYALEESFKFNSPELKKALEEYKKIHGNSPVFENYQKKYLGKYLSLIYLFGDYHQISGYNSIWLYVKDKGLFPKFRNEGNITFLNDRNEMDNGIFSVYNIKTSEIFQNSLIDYEIRYQRNLYLNELLKNKDSILRLFDEIEVQNREIHRKYNSKHFFVQNQHNVYRRIIEANFRKFEEYLNIGETFVSVDNEKIKVISDSYTSLELILNNEKSFLIKPRKFFVKNGQIFHELKENIFDFNQKILSVEIKSKITDKKIKPEMLKVIYEN